eukprot:6914565-Lingulodinium_polyedra.AAC.1
MQPVAYVTTKRGKTIEVDAKETTSELTWGDPILTTAMQDEFRQINYDRACLRRCRAWTISRSTRRSRSPNHRTT